MTSHPEPDYEGVGRVADGEAQGPFRQVPDEAEAPGPRPFGPDGTRDVTAVGGAGPAGGEAPRAAHGPEAQGAPPAEGDLAEDGALILADVAALSAERDEYLGALQRLKADFDNYRKRVLRQQEEQAARAAADLVVKLLPVLDTLDLAQVHLGAGPAGDGGADEGQALGQARAQLLDTLAKEGLERVDGAGVAFDPTVHDAVAHAPSADQAEGPGGEAAGEAVGEAVGGVVVDEVMRAGYRWRGQVLRPAMVRVRG